MPSSHHVALPPPLAGRSLAHFRRPVASGLDGGHGLIERGEARSVRGLDSLSASGLYGLALSLASPV